MYIRKLNLQNFKSYENQEFEFKNITLLTGLNGAGKSSIFQSIRMLKQFIDEGEPHLNSYGEVLNLKNKNKNLRENLFKLSFTNEDEKTIELIFNTEDTENIKFSSRNDTGFTLENYNIVYISANRQGPTEYQSIRNKFKHDYTVGINGEYTLDILTKHEDDNLPALFNDDALDENRLVWHVEKWLQVISPNTELKTELNQKMNIASFTINGFTPLNVGFGVSYTLSIIVQLLYSVILFEKLGLKSVLLIENPEAHLHPKGQTKIAELISKVSTFGVQVIVETHSDYVLDGLRLSVKSDIIHDKKTQLYYLELDSEKNTDVKSPIINEFGLLDKWPENFFDTSIKNKKQFLK